MQWKDEEITFDIVNSEDWDLCLHEPYGQP